MKASDNVVALLAASCCCWFAYPPTARPVQAQGCPLDEQCFAASLQEQLLHHWKALGACKESDSCPTPLGQAHLRPLLDGHDPAKVR